MEMRALFIVLEKGRGRQLGVGGYDRRGVI